MRFFITAALLWKIGHGSTASFSAYSDRMATGEELLRSRRKRRSSRSISMPIC